MQIDSLKDLEKVLKLARKLGVTTMKVDNIEFQLGSIPEKSKRSDFSNLDLPIEANIPVPQYQGTVSAQLAAKAAAQQAISEGQLTEEQMLMWSVSAEQ